jgi:hypothetical protein
MGKWECKDGTMVEIIFDEEGKFVKFGDGVTEENAEKVKQEIASTMMRKHVQIIDNDLVKRAEKEYPTLAKEVREHDKISGSSWYNLTPKAYEEWLRFY